MFTVLPSAALAAAALMVSTVTAHDLDARSTAAQLAARDGQHDFDFEFGSWNARLSHLDKPLSGSTTWRDYEGTSVVRQVWNGRANLGELDVRGAAGQIEGLTLRVYNPQTRQWHISWVNARDGMIGDAMSGEFKAAAANSSAKSRSTGASSWCGSSSPTSQRNRFDSSRRSRMTGARRGK